ncbi:Relaxase/Mobilisation nuclease domain-containing protein [Megasphaera elsdenii]|uniref:relaxase/mobilization nuclease domain-containing protein n=1 Tax=Megasphaera elsdenii TaxID=907 RepID=UPI0008EFB2D8|nr:relaxase/mobilization nuclease domain-containing protein [Megasphaera elsdenii]SFI55698.1 Relaxase/Mobilisation nuclease domain-containing protein [Megasphaera elsdenii]
MPPAENAIMRWINYKNTSYAGFEKALRYINNPKAAPVKYQYLGYLNPGHEVDDLRIINDRYRKPDDTRLYKHLICSFGDPELSAAKAYDFMTAFLASIGERHPVAFSIHTNVPQRLHGHAIIGMTDIWTGEKYSQSPQDLADWRTRYDEIAALPEFQMPLLRKSLKDCKNKGGVQMNINDKLETENRNEELLPWYHPSPVNTVPVNWEDPHSMGGVNPSIYQPLPVNMVTANWEDPHSMGGVNPPIYQPSPVNVVQPQPHSANMLTTYEEIAPAMPNDVSLCLAQARRFEAATGFVIEIGQQFWTAYKQGFEDGRNKK